MEFAFGSRRFITSPGQEIDARLYPLDIDFMLRKPSWYIEPRDEQGLPMRDYASVGRQYSPSRIMAWGLAHWNRLCAGTASSREPVLQAATWLAGFQNGRFNYCFDWGSSKSPWISCLAQGEGISLLLRASELDDQAGFLEVAQRAAKPLLAGINEEGVQGDIDGTPFLEEYPGEDHPHVLNGCLYAMVGLLDLVRHGTTPEVEALLDSVGATLERTIHRWDLGGWSAYDLSHETNGGHANACTPGYQAMQATLLEFVAREHSLERCASFAEAWLAARRNPLQRLNALSQKIRYRRRFPAQT